MFHLVHRRRLRTEPKAVVPAASESTLDVTQWIETLALTRGGASRSRNFAASVLANSRDRMRCIRSNASRSPVGCCSCHLRTTAALSSRRRITRASSTDVCHADLSGAGIRITRPDCCATAYAATQHPKCYAWLLSPTRQLRGRLTRSTSTLARVSTARARDSSRRRSRANRYALPCPRARARK